MEEINNYDLKDVYCPYRQGQCVSTCAMLIYDNDSRTLGRHSWVDEDGRECFDYVRQRYTNYLCGLVGTSEGRPANLVRIYGPIVCNGKPFDGMTDENIQMLAEVREKLAEVRGEES